MKFFLDTEFIEDGRTIDLLSIAIVCEDGREYYAEPAEADRQALRKLHQTLSKITNDFDSRWHFNTSIAGLMELTNELYLLESAMSGAARR